MDAIMQCKQMDLNKQTAGNAQEGPGPISAGPISKSINTNQLLTLEFYPCCRTPLGLLLHVLLPQGSCQCSRRPRFLPPPPHLQSSPRSKVGHEDLRVRAVEC